jgi:adenosylhomocysteine nucleosidase
MGTIAILCAMPMELQAVRRKLPLNETEIGGLPAYEGRLGDHDVVAAATGMGTALATSATDRLLDAVPVDRVLVVGITGAVENDTPIGTLVMPEVVINSETGTEHRPAPLGDAACAGTMWTTNELLTDLEVLAGLRERGVVCLDMETAAIAASCERRGIPWSVFRAISDRATDGTIDEEVFRLSNQDGTPNPRAIARYVLRHPGRLPSMVRLAKGAKLAADTAADAAIRAVATG